MGFRSCDDGVKIFFNQKPLKRLRGFRARKKEKESALQFTKVISLKYFNHFSPTNNCQGTKCRLTNAFTVNRPILLFNQPNDFITRQLFTSIITLRTVSSAPLPFTYIKPVAPSIANSSRHRMHDLGLFAYKIFLNKSIARFLSIRS